MSFKIRQNENTVSAQQTVLLMNPSTRNYDELKLLISI